MPDAPQSPPPLNPSALLRQGLMLEYLTLAWNIAGSGAMLYAAIRAGSVALAGFALDSLVEIGASAVVIWELSGRSEFRRKRGLQLIGAAFVALAVFVLIQSVRALVLRAHAGASSMGILWLALTAAVMLALAAGKFRVGRALQSQVLQTEGRVTLIDAVLALSVLVGLVLNAGLGWWWTDPAAGLVIVFYGLREGVHAWRAGAN